MSIKFVRTLIFSTLVFLENSKLYVGSGPDGKGISPKVKLSGRNKVVLTIGDETFDVVISKRKGK